MHWLAGERRTMQVLVQGYGLQVRVSDLEATDELWIKEFICECYLLY